MKTVSLKRTAAEKKVEGSAEGSSPGYETEDGADLHLEGSHIKKMDDKLENEAHMASLPHGHEIRFEGVGTVHRTSDGPEGGRMHIKVHRMGAEYDAPREEEGGLRGEIEKNTQDSDKRAEVKGAAKGKKVAEQANKTTE